MKEWNIFIAHNYYIYPGGEDIVFRSEIELLRNQGHKIVEYRDKNSRIERENPMSVALQTVWSWESYSKFYGLLSDIRPVVAHFHNTFPLISPSAYYACIKLKIPVVQTLHNYRLFCPAAIFYRDGAICEECLHKPFYLPAIKYKCFQESRLKTLVLATSLNIHNAINTWQRAVNVFIALTQFSKNKFVEAGLHQDNIFVKPNFVNKKSRKANAKREKYVIFVGRLIPEKGIVTLLDAWHHLNIPLYIFGDGPLRNLLLNTNVNIHYMGLVDRNELFSFMQRASFMVFPSEWYEGFPMTIVEAFSFSLSVLTSNVGSQAEIVQDGYSGLHFRAGNPDDLVAKSIWLWNRPDEYSRMGQNARQEYEEKYTPERNYQLLMDIYQKAIDVGNNKQ